MASDNIADRYDVIVVGGGAGGVGAAVGAARCGARTLLVEASGCLGGAASLRGVNTYCGIYTLGDAPRQVVFGVAEDVLVKLRRRGALSGPHRFRGVFLAFDPEANKVALDEICLEAGVEVQFHSRLIAATRVGERIERVTVHDHGGSRHLASQSFVDATGEANLAYLAGAATRYGNDGAVNLGSMATRFGGIPATVEVTAQQIAAAVEAVRRHDPRSMTKKSSVVARLPISGDMCLYVASADYDPRDFASVSRAEMSGRRQAQRYLEAIRSIPGCENAYLAATGPEFGTRESRHINARHQLTWHDIETRRQIDDCIALGAWGAEWHDRATFESALDIPADGTAYQIPLGCLLSADTENLFAAGRVADGDRKAGAAIRVMGTALASGQAAGVAAAGYAKNRTIDTKAVRRELVAQGALLEFP